MLYPEEFTIGTFASAPAGSLILPRTKYEVAAIVGVIGEASTVVILSGQLQFNYFPTAGVENWSGMIVPNVRIEVDEKTAFDPGYGRPPGSVIRASTFLGIHALSERAYGRTQVVPLVLELPAAAEGGVGFTKWQVVLGAGVDKQILMQIAVQAGER